MNLRLLKKAWDDFSTEKRVILKVRELNGMGSAMEKYRLRFEDSDGDYEYQARFLKGGTIKEIKETHLHFQLKNGRKTALHYRYKRRILLSQTLASSSPALNELIESLKQETRPSRIDISGLKVDIAYRYVFEKPEHFAACEKFRLDLIEVLEQIE